MPEGAKGTPEHAQLVMRYYTYNNVGGTTMLSGNGGADAGGPFWDHFKVGKEIFLWNEERDRRSN